MPTATRLNRAYFAKDEFTAAESLWGSGLKSEYISLLSDQA